jgi:uncharacterized protein
VGGNLVTALTAGIQLGRDLRLPLDFVVESTVIVGKRGRGKTVTGKRIVEQVHRARVPFVVIDPTDVWWGIRSGADGSEGGGLDVLIVGGKHGDVPLNEHAGKMLARMILDGTSMVVVTKGLPKAARRRLVGELLTELYDQADGRPILVVIDEADEYAPEGAKSFGNNRQNDPLVLSQGAVEDVVRRGRAGGLGTVLITQRVAVLSKSVLEQSDTLIAHGVTGKNDIDAVAAWIAKHASDMELSKKITTSLPGLAKGTAWVWAPEHGVLECVDVLPISTWDSSRSPSPYETVAVPKARKSIDLAALGEEMAKFAEQVKAEDPKELRKRIADLERQLRQQEAHTCQAVEPVEVPVLTLDDRAVAEGIIIAVDGLAELVRDRTVEWVTASKRIADVIATASAKPAPTARPVKAAPASVPASPAAAPSRRRTPPPAAPQPTAGDYELTDTESLLLQTLVQRHPIPMTVRELAVRARRSHTSSTTKTAVSRLRALGLASGGATSLIATEAGVAAAGGVGRPMPTGPALLGWWKERLTNAEFDLLNTLAGVWPDGMTDTNAYETAGYSATSSTPKTALGRLRSLGLVQKAGGINTCADVIGEAAHG